MSFNAVIWAVWSVGVVVEWRRRGLLLLSFPWTTRGRDRGIINIVGVAGWRDFRRREERCEGRGVWWGRRGVCQLRGLNYPGHWRVEIQAFGEIKVVRRQIFQRVLGREAAGRKECRIEGQAEIHSVKRCLGKSLEWSLTALRLEQTVARLLFCLSVFWDLYFWFQTPP